MLVEAPTGSIDLADRLTKPITDKRVTAGESPGSLATAVGHVERQPYKKEVLPLP
jgi:hypothetical protein